MYKRIGNYLLEREIGRGGSSEVWLARHEFLEHHQVAIKILTTQEREAIQRFIREANLTSRLNHPHIVKIVDHGYYPTDRSAHYLHCTIMEYVHGSSLQHLLDMQRTLPLDQAVAIFKQIAMALDYAHSLTIIHRDVSPGNILVSQDSTIARLTDFGIAREPSQKITVDYSIMGTPGFWSPEHTRSATEVTPLSDIYSLGVVFYTMLSGELPWDTLPGPSERIFPPPLPLKERGVQNLPTDVDRVIQTMLANDPTRRFPSAQAAVEELERVLNRHHLMTQVTTLEQQEADAANRTQRVDTSSVVAYHSSFCISEGVQQNAVEDVLGPHLVRSVMTQAHQRAAELGEPAEIVRLLNAWSAKGFFRRRLLGRLARLRRISSRNVYFYHLDVVYEQRGDPQSIEEPDHQAREFPLEPELGCWYVELPQVYDFKNEVGPQVVLPGSTHVIRCSACEGKGKTRCPECKGKQRIYVTRVRETGAETARDEDEAEEPAQPKRGRKGKPPAQLGTGTEQKGKAQPSASGAGTGSGTKKQPDVERVLEPCPNCAGSGGIRCERCDGVGRLVERKAFRWQRVARSLEESDELSDLDEQWLGHACEEHEVYRERVGGDARPNGGPVLRQEWMQVPVLAELVQQAQDATDEHTRIALSEVTITCIPVTDIVFALQGSDEEPKKGDDDDPDLYRLSIYGFERVIPPDWRLLNWERVIFICVTAFLSLVVLMLGYVVFLG